jgi:hypothetical protein
MAILIYKGCNKEGITRMDKIQDLYYVAIFAMIKVTIGETV